MKLDPFYIRALHYIRSLIRQREFLLHSHRSPRAPLSYLSDLQFLKTHLEINHYSNDRQVARFWMYHHDKIRNLIPGKGSPVHDSLTETYHQLTKEAGHLFSQLLVSPEITPKASPTINP
jgi:hypothetical protein